MDSKQQNLVNQEKVKESVPLVQSGLRFTGLSAIPIYNVDGYVMESETIYPGPYRNPKSIISSDSSDSTIVVGGKRKAAHSFPNHSPKKARLQTNSNMKPEVETINIDSTAASIEILKKIPELTVRDILEWYFSHMSNVNEHFHKSH